MADHNKEIDSKFYIFLPHLATSNPVSDIDKGPRFSCFVGELLNFFLIAQFRGKKRSPSESVKLHEWQERLLGLSTSVSVNCVELAIHKGHDALATSSFISCSPTSTSRIKSGSSQELTEDLKPLVTSQGDIIYPLNVSLDVLPALSRRIKLSVNVWTPELNAEAKVNTQSLWNDYYDIFVYNDPDEILNEVQNTFRCHVNATLPVISPPTVRCKYNYISNKQYVALEVINSLGEPVILHQASVHPSCSTLYNTSNKLHNQRSCDMFVMPINTKQNELPISLLPWEHISFLYRIIRPENQTSKDKCFEISLMSAVSWSVETLRLREQKIKTIYSLPLFNISRPSVSVRATCKSIVQKGKRFQVKYTVTNTEDEECNVCLRWQPQYNDMMPGMHNLDAESLVCLQPNVRIGCCPPGSCLSVNVEFLAMQEGLHEVGQFMTCKWNTGSLTSSPSRSLSPVDEEFEGFTTASHSCQVFVVVDFLNRS